MKLSVLLEDAKKSHDALVKILEESFPRLDAASRWSLFEENPKRWVLGFDLAIESVLLELALSFGKDPVPYLTYIRAMNYFSYDVLEFTNEYLKIRGERCHHIYDDFVDPKEGPELLAFVKEAVAPIAQDAISGGDTWDYLGDKATYDALEDSVLRLVDCFLLCCKDTDAEQTRNVIETVRDRILVPVVEHNKGLFGEGE